MRLRDDGFTLIELLIVIAILAILVSIVAVNVTGLLTGVTETALQVELDLVQVAIDKYNSWDVSVNGASPIADIGDWRRVTAGDPDAPFGKYLSRPTRFYYTWNYGGADLVNKTTP